MTKRDRQIREVEAVMDGKPLLKPLERVYHKINMFRSRANSGVSLRLSPEETDEVLLLLRLPSVDHALLTDQEVEAIHREAYRYKVGKRGQ